MSNSNLVFHLADEAATQRVAEATASECARLLSEAPTGLSLYLRGELGAGKTTFVRYLLRQFGITGRIKSPTYGLAESYDISPSLSVWHFDFYRMNEPHEWQEAGFEELWSQRVLRLVEWPQMAGDTLPVPDVQLQLRRDAVDADSSSRELQLSAYTDIGKGIVKLLKDRGIAA